MVRPNAFTAPLTNDGESQSVDLRSVGLPAYSPSMTPRILFAIRYLWVLGIVICVAYFSISLYLAGDTWTIWDPQGFLINIASGATAACFGVPIAFFVLQGAAALKEAQDKRVEAIDLAKRAFSRLQRLIALIVTQTMGSGLVVTGPISEYRQQIIRDVKDASEKLSQIEAASQTINELLAIVRKVDRKNLAEMASDKASNLVKLRDRLYAQANDMARNDYLYADLRTDSALIVRRTRTFVESIRGPVMFQVLVNGFEAPDWEKVLDKIERSVLNKEFEFDREVRYFRFGVSVIDRWLAMDQHAEDGLHEEFRNNVTENLEEGLRFLRSAAQISERAQDVFGDLQQIEVALDGMLDARNSVI